MSSMTPPPLSDKQKWSIGASTRKKIALWVGAVSAGKTIASLIAFVIAVMKTTGRGRIVIIGKTLQTIERNIIEPLQSPDLFGDVANHVEHTTGSSIAYILGKEIHLIGANDTRAEEKIRGATIELAYVDEATLLPVGFWEMLITRLRVAGARLLATTNPGSFNHWLNLDWIKAKDQKNMIVFHFTMHDNPLYFEGGDPGPQYVEEMEAAFAGIFYDRFILGLWTNAEGAIFDMFDPAKHKIRWEDLPIMSRLLAVGVDYGTTNPTSALLLGLALHMDGLGKTHPKLYLIDEYRYESSTTKQKLTDGELSQQLRNWLGEEHLPNNQRLQPDYVILDPSAASFRVQLSKDGLVSTQANNEVLYGIRLVTSLLQSGQLLVSDRCTGWLKEVTEYVWDSKATEKGEDKPLKANDHSMDAARYAIATTESIWRQYVTV
ncbi:MAG: PBSX family phage terminase large subunit [Microbacteriaceae bacterium]